MPTPDEHAAAIRAAGAELETADAQRAAALEHLRAALRAAKGSVSVRQMAEHSGVTRVTVYRLLEDA